MKEIKNIVLIGAGNLATHLGPALQSAGKNIVQVISGHEKTAETLAIQLGAGFSSELAHLKRGQDLYIIAVNDAAIAEVVKEIQINDALLVHTSGAVPVEVLENASANTGVIYPLSTFSKQMKVDFRGIDIFIEATKQENRVKLQNLASLVSDKVHLLSGEQRQVVHLSAVFASNFTNHMYAVAADILKKHDLDFELLRPIIMETAKKIQNELPFSTQTGPAARKDIPTIEKHLELLKGMAEYHDIYRIITQNIIQMHKKGKGNDEL